ncbi:nucleolar protein 14 homolog [Anoplophora glabripennis]|nr:nucleolar protein 14 homolog [Anoplophora glabripennis]XP_018579918.1 nucleolar protein 14 homolog [Anoplophora glabripennis]
MAKRKNKRKSADYVHSKKESVKSKNVMNPFEIHVNKEKLRVLGKKQKNDRGVPGISRAKAIQKRKHTLLKEYKGLHKSNKFMDKRIGEKNYIMTNEDKSMARFTAVRVKAHNKKSIFNLADDEVLTHKGQTLSEIEKFEDPRSDDESLDDENVSGNLDQQFVADAHFGGGVLKNTGKEGAKTHKELIDQLIAESKKRKAEKQKTKEATLELTEKLDSEWKDLLPIVNPSKKVEEEVNKSKVDDYDKVMRELKFEARGTVSDRLKTEDEIVKEEKEKLEKLEQERVERMRGDLKQSISKPNHRSADDLEDDFVYESDPEYMLSYNKEGETNVQIDAEINGVIITQNNESEVEVSQKNSGDRSDEDEEPEIDSEDNLSDLKDGDSESESDIEASIATGKNELENRDIKNEEVLKVNNDRRSDIKEDKSLQDKIKDDLLKRKEVMEQARKELPYTFTLPESYESLQKTFENQSSSHQNVIIERMIKCNHPSLAEGNKENLGLLFAYLLQYVNDLFEDVTDAESIKNSFEIFSALIPQIYDLAQLNPENAHHSVLEVMKEKQGEYRKKPKEHPGYEILAFLKLVSSLFPTSDFRHQIVTPCFVFIEQMLTKCKVKCKRDISYGLFLSTLILEYTVISKRYLPAVIIFLTGILHMAVPKSKPKLIKILPPFKATASDLVLLENYSLGSFKSLHLDSKDLVNDDISEEYKVRVLYVALKLLEEFYNNLKELSSSIEIFNPVLRYLDMIPTCNYPREIKTCLEDLTNTLRNGKVNKKLNYIIMAAERPKALRLYEPKIEEVYDGKRYKKQSKVKAERDKMLHKLKKETKGALREIRRDKAFLGRIKINERIQSDKERKDKVKRLYAEAAMQQSELNSLDRKRKKK